MHTYTPAYVPPAALDSLPDALLARVLFLAAAAERADAFCSGPLEERVFGLAPPPDAAPGRALALRLVSRRFRRLLDGEPAAWERLALDTVPEREARADLDDLRRSVDEGDGSRDFPPGPSLAWLLGLSPSARGGVRTLRLGLDFFSALGRSQLAALTDDGPLRAGLERLDLYFAGGDFLHTGMVPVCALPLLARLPNLVSLRVGLRSSSSNSHWMELLQEHRAPLKAALAPLATLGRLRELDLSAFPVPLDALRALAGLPLVALRAWIPRSAPGDALAALRAVAECFPALERLRVGLCPDVGEDAMPPAPADELRPLASLTALRSLHLGAPVHSAAFLAPLARLEHLRLQLSASADAAPLAALGPCLRSLALVVHPDDGDGGDEAAARASLAAALSRLAALEGLEIWVPSAAMEELASRGPPPPAGRWPRLRIARLQTCWGEPVPAAVVAALLREAPRLEELAFLLSPPPDPDLLSLPERARLPPIRRFLAPSFEDEEPHLRRLEGALGVQQEESYEEVEFW